MSNHRYQNGNRKYDRSYISRDEFEVFEKNVDRNFSDLGNAVSNLNTKLDKMGSTDWKTFGMFAGLILTVVSLGGSLLVRDFTRLEFNQATLEREQVEEVRYLEAELSKIDDRQDHVSVTRWSKADQEKHNKDQLAEFRRLETLIGATSETLSRELRREFELLLELHTERFRFNEANILRLQEEIKELQDVRLTDASTKH